MRHDEHQCFPARTGFSAAIDVKKPRKRPVFLGKRPVSHEACPGGKQVTDDMRITISRRWIFPEIVQNYLAQKRCASLLRSAMHMPENNYPQTYPTLEDMLVITNIAVRTGHETRAANETTPQTARYWGVVARPSLADGKLGFPDLERANFGRLRSFRTILDFEFDFLPFVQAAIAAALDGGKVCENVGATGIRRNEPVTLVSVEPLDFALLSHFPSVL